MTEEIKYEVRYETPNGVETIDTARYVSWEDGMTTICWYPHATKMTHVDELVRMQETKTKIPTGRIIQIDEI